jgi:mannose-6-phosphate isomerase-like protein (cupin superfamily)
MDAKKVMESYHFVHDGFDFYEPVSKTKFGVSLNCVLIPRPLGEHSHPEIEQIYYIRSGRGILKIDGEEQEVEKDMVIYIPAGATHGIKPLESDEELSYLFFSHFHEISSKDVE